ncbi:hypothetical protein X777_13889 [Ooceraea biroi]|uniref:Uncharacterized protein n=1 Tax=Ooceraea biroi TaxID=2015173 RepID=A0A026WY53_OOCBI|nr:hypothetical protein X777_13889 [Ooceraea biroi]
MNQLASHVASDIFRIFQFAQNVKRCLRTSERYHIDGYAITFPKNFDHVVLLCRNLNVRVFFFFFEKQTLLRSSL